MLTLIAAGAAIGLLAPAAFAATSVVPPGGSFAGKDYKAWSIAWWQWAAPLHLDDNPLADAAAPCGIDQRGPVWFVAAPGFAETWPSCTIPEGKAVLVPVLNGECSTNEYGNIDLAACASSQLDGATVTASVDGRAVDASLFRTGVTAQFPINWATDNIFGAAPGAGRSVADGFYLLLRPLSEGRHTVDVHGSVGTFFITAHFMLNVAE
jgi:hypothetical protein